MANAYNNLRGFVRDVRAAREAASRGDKDAGSLLDALCDELDVLLDFGGDDDDGGDSGHASGGDDPEGMAESDMEAVDDGPQAQPAARRGAPREYSVRGGVRTPVLREPVTGKVLAGKYGTR